VIELDDQHHRNQKQYDQQRSLWLAELGIGTVRFWNSSVFAGTAEARIREMLGLEKRDRC
jgi:very-short-patch-repair endonuclease